MILLFALQVQGALALALVIQRPRALALALAPVRAHRNSTSIKRVHGDPRRAAFFTVIPVLRRHSVELALRGEWLWIVFVFVVVFLVVVAQKMVYVAAQPLAM